MSQAPTGLRVCQWRAADRLQRASAALAHTSVKALLLLVLALTGCAHRVEAPVPAFKARACPADSVPLSGISYLAADGKGGFNRVVLPEGAVCQDKISKQVFFLQSYDPYTHTDGDDPDEQPKAKSPWWRFWAHRKDKD